MHGKNSSEAKLERYRVHVMDEEPLLIHSIRNFLWKLALRQSESDEGLTLETSAFRIAVRWPIYIINSVDKTIFLYTTSPPTQHHSFVRNGYLLHSFPIGDAYKYSDIFARFKTIRRK